MLHSVMVSLLLLVMLMVEVQVSEGGKGDKMRALSRDMWNCGPDVIQFCGKAARDHAGKKGRKDVSRCLDRHWYELSPACRDMKSISHVSVPEPECLADAKMLCGRMSKSTEVITCLRQHPSTSLSCVTALPKPTHWEELSREFRVLDVDGDCPRALAIACMDVRPGEGRLSQCIKKAWKELSNPCRLALRETPEAEHVMCKADIAKFCRKVRPGDGRLAACLNEHVFSLAEPCRTAHLLRLNDLSPECAPDVVKFCPDVPIIAEDLVACLQQHEPHLQQGCTSRKLDPTRHRRPALDGDCSEDVRKYCRGVGGGGGRITLCLALNAANLTHHCKKLLPDEMLREHIEQMNVTGDVRHDEFYKNSMDYIAKHRLQRMHDEEEEESFWLALVPSSSALTVGVIFVTVLCCRAQDRIEKRRARAERARRAG